MERGCVPVAIIELLLSCGADVLWKDGKGRNAWQKAKRREKERDTARALLREAWDAQVTGKQGAYKRFR